MKVSLKSKYFAVLVISFFFSMAGVFSLYFLNQQSTKKLIETSSRNIGIIYDTGNIKSLFAEEIRHWSKEIISVE